MSETKPSLKRKGRSPICRSICEREDLRSSIPYWDEEHNLYGFEVQESNGGNEKRSKVHWDLIASVEYRQLIQVYGEIQEMAPPPYVLVEKGREVTLDSEEKLAPVLPPDRKGRIEYPEV